MSRRLVLFACAIVLAGGVLAGDITRADQAQTPAARWRRALDAWDAGRYPDALADLRAIMQSSSAAEFRDRVALLSGELFVTTELTTDGRNPRVSTTGKYTSYETGPTARAVTRLTTVTDGKVQLVAELAGTDAAIDAAESQVVWLRPKATLEWAMAVAALDAAGSNPERQAAQAQVTYLLGRDGDLVVRNLASGAERVLPTVGLAKTAPMWAGDGRSVLFIGEAATDSSRVDIYSTDGTGAPVRLTDQAGFKSNVLVDPTGRALVYTVASQSPFRQPAGAAGAARAGGGGRAGAGAGGGAAGAGRAGAGGAPGGGSGPNPCGGGGGRGAGGGTSTFAVVDLAAKATRLVSGQAVTMSADGSTIAWLTRDADKCTLSTSPAISGSAVTVRTASRLDTPALSPDGKLVAYDMMPLTDWEIYVSDGQTERRITHEIQHDILPRFLSNTMLVGMIGEPRHRRSYLYDLATTERTRLFANNTIRTISPEYIWLPSADGKKLVIQAERDGDTVSPDRGVYVVDLTRKVTVADVLARLDRQLVDENDLRARMTKAYQPISDAIKRVVAQVSTTRIYEHEKALGDFDTKYIGRPGNLKAIDYLTAAYASFGYTPAQQWFEPRQAQGARTANVVATLKGTENPDLVYVVGSHFDSVQAGPGADDDTTGTCVLLEIARVLHATPMPATIVFASFTGEEAGDLGSHEFVRLAAEANMHVAGALNNDMIGWAGESARMDNTIRYSNAGIKDLQHGAAMLFSNLITYDARYYKGTDASAFFDGWGDIVGGFGSYPVLGNPNYHQPTDTIETVSFQQIAETAKATAGTIMYLASSPSRLTGLKASRTSGSVNVTWTPSPESGVSTYVVAYGPAADPQRNRITVTDARATLPAVPAGTQVAVKAVHARGLEGWDWARTVVQ
jgi:Tol biopolymer transport system component